MTRCHVIASCVFAGIVTLTVSGASADGGPLGAWNRDDGLGGIRIDACGSALCGHVTWLRDRGGPAFIGQKVLFDMRQTAADTWSGMAHNPEDGKDYSGSITVAGDRLLTKGCIFGGLICKSVGLTRAR